MSFDDLWERMVSLQGAVFHTSRGKPFTFTISGGVVRVDRKANPITKATVVYAFDRAEELSGNVPGPKALGCFGASYLYPILIDVGVVNEEKTDNGLEVEDMPRPKGSKES